MSTNQISYLLSPFELCPQCFSKHYLCVHLPEDLVMTQLVAQFFVRAVSTCDSHLDHYVAEGQDRDGDKL